MPITVVTGPDGEPLNFPAGAASPDGNKVLLQSPTDSGVDGIYDINLDELTLLPETLEGRSVDVFRAGVSNEGLVALSDNFVPPLFVESGVDLELAVIEPDGTLVRVIDPPDGLIYDEVSFPNEATLVARLRTADESGVVPSSDFQVIDLATGDVTAVDVGAPGFDRNVTLLDSFDDLVLVAGPEDYSLYDVENGSLSPLPFEFRSAEPRVAFAVNGSGLLVEDASGASGKRISLFNLESGAIETTVSVPSATYLSTDDVAVDPSGRFLAAASSQREGYDPFARTTLTLFDLEDGGQTSIGLRELFPDATSVSDPAALAVKGTDGAPVVSLRLLVDGRGRLFEVNLDVLAYPDQAETAAGEAVAVDVLANDLDFGEDGLEVVAATGAANGTLTIEGGEVVYTPDEGFAGEDSFAYTVRDGGGAEDTAEAVVLVTAPDPEGFVVTTAEDAVVDDGLLSIREAVARANATPGEDTITFAEGMDRIELRGVEDGVEEGLVVTDDLVIDGGLDDGEPGGVTIVDPIRDLRGDYDYGTAVLSVVGAELALEDLTISGGRIGVHASEATLTAERVSIDRVGAFSYAAGIRSQGSTVTLVDSEISGTSAGYDAFVIRASDGSDVELLRSTVGGNFSYYGGTINVDGRLRVEDSTISNNTNLRAGDLVNVDGELEIVNSTIARNTFDGYEAHSLVNLESGSGSIVNSTIAGNEISDPRDNPVIAIEAGDGAELTLTNSLVLDNFSRAEGPAPVIVGPVQSGGGNVFDASPAGAASSDVVGAAPADVFAVIEEVDVDRTGVGVGIATLPVLADNGGPTRTIALADDPANPALGQAAPATAPASDQRGFERDADPDAGAFELGADDGGVSPPPPPPPPDGDALTVTFLSEEADYANSLGYYLDEDGDGTPDRFGILFEEVSDGALEPGDSVTLDLDGADPSGVGFFLIRDGADLGLDFEGAAFAFDGRGGLFVTEVGGETTRLKDYQVQYDFEEGQLLIQEIFPPIYNWEDKGASEGSYDGDFNDAVFEVRFEAGDDALVV